MDLNRIIQDLKAEREVLGGGRGTTGECGEEAAYDYGIGCGTTCRLRKAMGSDRYLPFLPIILNWIQQTLDAHAHERRAVSSFKFPRLPHYFSEGLLNTASVVPCDHLPVPPLSALGLREFADFESQPISGITYRDTYFLSRAVATDESLHFHELVHVVQWQVLGPRDFLLMYAAGLAESGYRDSALEAMAYDHQRRFDAGDPPYSVEAEVREQTLALKPAT